jgi:transcription elongation factor GreA
MNEQNTFLTEAGLIKLKGELDQLKNTKRREISERIQEAKELGDLSENAEYVEAKNDQAFVEGRILEIESILKNATIIKQKSRSKDHVEIGSKIKIEDGQNTKEYYIVGSNEADPAVGKISNESPLGQAFIGKKIGDIVEINVPQGIKKFKIITVA